METSGPADSGGEREDSATAVECCACLAHLTAAAPLSPLPHPCFATTLTAARFPAYEPCSTTEPEPPRPSTRSGHMSTRPTRTPLSAPSACDVAAVWPSVATRPLSAEAAVAAIGEAQLHEAAERVAHGDADNAADVAAKRAADVDADVGADVDATAHVEVAGVEAVHGVVWVEDAPHGSLRAILPASCCA
eukprot:229694-Pleurochrysis_carterae.AAC.1